MCRVNRKMVGIGCVLVVLILVIAATPYVLGVRVETEFRAGVNEAATQIGYPIEVVEYDRGWLYSHAVTRLELDDRAIDIENDITHGPFLVLGWARIHSQMPKDATPELRHLFEASPLTATTTIGFGDRMSAEIQSPSFDKGIPDEPGVHIVWKGAQARYVRSGNRVDIEMNAPGVEIDDHDKHTVFDDLSVTASGSAIPNRSEPDVQIDWDSAVKARVGRFRVYDDAGTFGLDYGMQLDVNTANGDNDTVDTHLAYRLNKLTLRTADPGVEPVELKVDEAHLNFDLTGLMARPLEETIRALDTLYAEDYSHQEIQAGTMRIFAEQMPAVLSGTPHARLAIPPVKTGYGEFSGEIKTELKSPDILEGRMAEMARESPLFGLFQRWVFDGHAFVDERLVQTIIDDVSQGKLGASQSFQAQLDTLVRQQFLQRKDDQIGVSMYFDRDTMTLNGQEIPPRQIAPLFNSLIE